MKDQHEQFNKPSELIQELENIKHRASPQSKMWHKTYYVLLFFCSLLPLASYSLVFLDLDWDSLRMVHGLLPVEAIFLRSNLPAVLPLFIVICFVLSFKFKLLRSSGFLAWLALFIFFLLALYGWLTGMITWHLATRLALYNY